MVLISGERSGRYVLFTRSLWIAFFFLLASRQEQSQDRPLGDPPPIEADSTLIPDRSTPESLLREIFAARLREDLPFLARCHQSTAGKRALDKLDLALAWRTFSQRSVGPLWTTVETAFNAGRFTTRIDADTAAVTFDVGGAKERTTLHLVRIGTEWHLR